MSSKTPKNPRRFVIVDSPSGDSSSSSGESVTLSAGEECNNLPGNGVGGLSAAMSRVNIADKLPRRCNRGGIDSVEFLDSDSDSSFEAFISTFKPKPKTIELDSSSSDDSSVEIVDGARQKDSNNETEADPWTFDESTDEYFLASTQKTKMPKFRIPSKLYKRLFDHQKSGVSWVAGLHKQRIGGLLGDDMGMGKTYMALTFLGGMLRTKTIRNALIVAPLSVLRSWETEAEKVLKLCVPHVIINVVSSDIGKATRFKRLRTALQCSTDCPHLVITTYGLIGSSPLDFCHDYHTWDYVILDEAHKIKNPSAQISKNCRRVTRSEDTRRLILTGTPIMNNLKELWALIDFATSGKLLGTLPRFKNWYASPIEDARSKDATSHMMRIGEKANTELQNKLRPYFIQRLKIDFLADMLPKKRDFVVWTHLSDRQRSMYSKYVEAGDSAVAQVLTGISTSPLEAVTWLKKLCGHPILVDKNGEVYSESLDRIDPNALKKYSSKLQVLDALIERLRSRGHRTLIFSQSTKMLDIIERVLHRVKLSRIDGSTKEKDRQRRVDEFNRKSTDVEVMLLSTKAAGVGLTLTGADRAIVYDPSWNPAEDSQAVDRCYRIGQNKEVTVFRFITAGTVEEKMYEKQVHKDGIRRAVMTSMGSATTRYFDKDGLRKLFKLGEKGQCEFLDRLRERGLASEESSPEVRLTSHDGVVGVSSHDSLYTSEALVTISENGNTEATQENPFSSPIAPPKPANSRQGQLDGGPDANTEGDSAFEKVMGRSQRALFKNQGANTVQGGQQRKSRIVNKENSDENMVIHEIDQKKTVVDGHDRNSVTDRLHQIDKLRESGNLVSALEMLMDSLEGKYHAIGKAEKMKIHERISTVAYDLRWL